MNLDEAQMKNNAEFDVNAPPLIAPSLGYIFVVHGTLTVEEEDHDDESLLDFFYTFELVALIATIEGSNGSSLVSLFQYLSVNYSNCGFILGYLHFLAKECFMRKWPDTDETSAFCRPWSE